MSSFEIIIRKLDAVEPHPNADKLDLAQIGGYRAIVKKGQHTAGELVLYIQEDAVFTDLEVARILGIDTYLTGKNNNRVKPIKLRGILSQGIVVPICDVERHFKHDSEFGLLRTEPCVNLWVGYEGIDFADLLKIEKYEEPIPIQMRGKVRRWPSFLPHYDIENIKRPESMVAMVEGEEVVVTEKLHGTNMTVAFGPGLEEGEEAFVCSRNLALKEDSVNVYWRATRQFDLIEKLKAALVLDENNSWINGKETIKVENISLHGEVIGVQDLKYGLDGGNIEFRAFDIMVNGQFLDWDNFNSICVLFRIPRVPELYRGPYNYDKIVEITKGKTTVAGGHIMEGGVVRPVKERKTSTGDRAQFKFISEHYLLRGNNATEYH